MPRLPDLKFLRLISFSTLLFSIPVLAQFEIAPDHFDSNRDKAVTTHKGTAAVRPQNGLQAKGAAVSHPLTSAAATKARKKQTLIAKHVVSRRQVERGRGRQ